jgi:hypothetical protein
MAEYEDKVIPMKYMGNQISLTNQVNSLVALTVCQTGEDPLQGTGLTYGSELSYDVSGSAPEGGAAMALEASSMPSVVAYTPGDPYKGMPQ